VAETQLPGVSLRTAGYLPAEPALAVRDTQLSCGISTRGEVRKERLHIAAGGRQYRHDMTGVSRFDVVA